MNCFYPGVHFVINGKKYFFMQMKGINGNESILLESINDYDLSVFGYPYNNSHPGLGKVKAWIKTQNV